MHRSIRLTGAALALTLLSSAAYAATLPPLSPKDVFELEYAASPQISPDGKTIVYVRTSMDVMKDKPRRNLWTIDVASGAARPLLSGADSYGSPRWSPDGKKLAYVTGKEGSAQIYVRWMDTGATARITDLTEGPGQLAWSPDGKWIAFTMFVPVEKKPLAAAPEKPEGATWAPPVKVIDEMIYRSDEEGWRKPGYSQLFVVPADGGTPRQLTHGHFDHGAKPSWTPDGKAIVISANRHEDADYQPANSEAYEITVADGSIRPITDRNGPDAQATLSPDGKMIAVVGFDDRKQGYQVATLDVMDRDGKNRRTLTASLDRDAQDPVWKADGKGLYFLYDDKGITNLAEVSLSGKITVKATGLGGLDYARPYTGGTFTATPNGVLAFELSTSTRPSEVGVLTGAKPRQLTHLNEDILGQRDIPGAEEMWVKSTADGRDIQAWLIKPAGYQPGRKYPLVLEIHGGPFAAYGPHFAAEDQAYAAAGYAVLYVNPRGSTSYGEEFGNLIHHNYPSQDYDDLMSAVDAAIARGFIDEKNLFVTGGSGGGVLTAWIVGKTDRFRAAVVAKPVINWASFVLTADSPVFFTDYWFGKKPWEDPEGYWKRSPLSLVGNVKTPTMLITGESDYRTPISETEQYYAALKLQKVPTAMVRMPGASHGGMTDRPTNLIAKSQNIIAWFERYRTDGKKAEAKAGE